MKARLCHILMLYKCLSDPVIPAHPRCSRSTHYYALLLRRRFSPSHARSACHLRRAGRLCSAHPCSSSAYQGALTPVSCALQGPVVFGRLLCSKSFPILTASSLSRIFYYVANKVPVSHSNELNSREELERLRNSQKGRCLGLHAIRCPSIFYAL
ncbi:hypothetical protein BOTBODRAFT_577976 [Botryobasidium botryosum FD-172 SS1]|uniref:Uncharacterized protein n=1 Tax=Botryobasidium botryosum (strain FD-172 SS1) TaxID=930990 RepID=A0A067MPT3_BOTB1|nr:hypothetical protein BOTBODRAFT_577976 [Botryobasidium botryosum FD-172 SS1]